MSLRSILFSLNRNIRAFENIYGIDTILMKYFEEYKKYYLEPETIRQTLYRADRRGLQALRSTNSDERITFTTKHYGPWPSVTRVTPKELSDYQRSPGYSPFMSTSTDAESAFNFGRKNFGQPGLDFHLYQIVVDPSNPTMGFTVNKVLGLCSRFREQNEVAIHGSFGKVEVSDITESFKRNYIDPTSSYD
ncbi:MAG: hypothetical protein NBV76_06855 [Candidatus Ochrobactrum gambitense]|nr:MAG: hypothetical protein NBV76_06855 [Candidatus Ochrobactrum gambitense]WEK16932.1 MAG: hypothetical protein P0Y54_04105 [Candidatus Ochrobactrum gambitense]